MSAPANLNLAPPGRYMLFVLDTQGVPSMARIVSVADAAHPPTLPVFDGLEYIASYPDLIQAFGADAAAGEMHYQQYGQAEGRVPDSFDARQYLANYADLRAAFGSDRDAAAAHSSPTATTRAAPTRRRRRGIDPAAAGHRAWSGIGCRCTQVRRWVAHHHERRHRLLAKSTERHGVHCTR